MTVSAALRMFTGLRISIGSGSDDSALVLGSDSAMSKGVIVLHGLLRAASPAPSE
jgi:hypothetical protein